MPENPQQSRRHFHRGRRGPDRRATDRRVPQNSPEPSNREQVDVEQIMRDIRGRVSSRPGVELSNQQIQELAARRLEAILDPRHIKPAMLDQLRKSAGEPVEAAASPDGGYAFEDTTLYETHRGLLRFIRRLLNPILKLFFNPTPLVQALNTQARLNREAAEREAERERRQAEWNALHYELLQRLVMEVSRVAVDTQAQSMRIESLAAKVDFNERRVRSIENAMHQGRVPQSSQRPAPPESPAPAAPRPAEPAAEPVAVEGGGDAPRRRRRRRRGRRGGPGASDVAAAADASIAANDGDDGDLGDEGSEDESTETVGGDVESVVALEPAHAMSPLQRHEPPSPPATVTPDPPATSVAPAQPDAPRDHAMARGDEPAPAASDRTDQGPADR
jgi:hypothetical protein